MTQPESTPGPGQHRTGGPGSHAAHGERRHHVGRAPIVQGSVGSPQPSYEPVGGGLGTAYPASSSDATRYLCAAGYLDADFRRLAIDELIYGWRRSVAPSYGFDVVPVVRHCLAAHRLVLLRDVALTVIMVIALLVQGWAALSLVIPALIAWGLVRLADRANRAGWWRLLGPLARPRVLAGVLLVGLGILTLGGSFGELAWAWQFESHFGRGVADLTGQALARLLLLGLFPVLAVIVLGAHRAVVHREIVERLQPGVFGQTAPPPGPAWAQARINDLAGAQRGNVTYVAESRREAPFVGAGTIHDAYGFAVRLRREQPVPDQGSASTGAPHDLTARTVYEALRRAIISLRGQESGSTGGLGQLTIQDRLYVNGMLRPNSRFLDQSTGTVRREVRPDEIDWVSLQERGVERRFLVARVSTWGGDVEVSLFYYVAVRGDMLYVECTATVLPPVNAAFHAIDSWERLSGWAAAHTAASAMLDLIRLAPVAPFRLLAAGYAQVVLRRRENDEQRQTRARLAFDYGARLGLREIAAAPGGWFAVADASEIRQLIDHRAFDAIVDVLRSSGYQVAEFETRANVVINNSTTNLSGATISGSALATGSASRATHLGTNPGPGGAASGSSGAGPGPS